MRILNIGSGDDDYGTDRLDIIANPNVTKVFDINKALIEKRELPYKSNTFDEIYSRATFEHISNPMNFLLELKRMCKAGGKIIIITDNYSFLDFCLRGHHGRYGGGEDRHYAIYGIDYLKTFFQKANLFILEAGYDTLYGIFPQERKLVEKNLKENLLGLLKRRFLRMFGARLGSPYVYIIGVKPC